MSCPSDNLTKSADLFEDRVGGGGPTEWVTLEREIRRGRAKRRPLQVGGRETLTCPPKTRRQGEHGASRPFRGPRRGRIVLSH